MPINLKTQTKKKKYDNFLVTTPILTQGGIGKWTPSGIRTSDWHRILAVTQRRNLRHPPKQQRARRRTNRPHLYRKTIYTEVRTCARGRAGAAFGVENAAGTVGERPTRSRPQPKRNGLHQSSRRGARHQEPEILTVSLRPSRSEKV